MKQSRKKVVLGVNGWNDRGHDASACIVVNGKIIAFAEEERFTRKRYSYDSLPISAIAYCLEEAKLEVDDIDIVVFGWDMPKTYKMRIGKFPFTGKEILEQIFPNNPYKYKKLPRLEFLNHHIAHSASSYRVSGFENASILVLDGQGEDTSGTLAYAKKGKIEVHSQIPISYSLGYMMEAACKYIGLRTSDAGKLMGLAGHGKKGKPFDNIQLNSLGYSIKGFKRDKDLITNSLDEQGEVIKQWLEYFRKMYPLDISKKYMLDTLKGTIVSEVSFTQKHKDFALCVQSTLEDVVIHLAKLLIMKTKCRDLVISGGIGLNCTTNGRLVSENIVDNLFVMPAANDAGVSVGAALEVSYREYGYRFPKMEDIYLGPRYSDKQMESVLKLYKVPFNKVKNVEKLAAKSLASGKTVAWFQGRMEGGPRALGNRSIVANPRIKEMHNVVNVIKSRENWRPLAPSILEEYVDDYFENASPSPFMLQTHKVKRDKARNIPAVVHKDRTARFQSVSKKINSKYYSLINEFYKLTNIPLVMNTSLNIGGEPLVCTPEQAIKTFYLSGIDCLALGDYWITKK